MKRTLIIFCCLVSVFTAKAQWAVVDVTAEKNAIQQIGQLKKQYEALSEQKKKLDESLDFMRKVNGTLRNLRSIEYLLDRQKNLNSECSKIMKRSDILSIGGAKQMFSTAEMIYNNNARILNMIKTVLSDNLKMNDSERLQMLEKMKEELHEEERKIYKMNRILDEYETLKRLCKVK